MTRRGLILTFAATTALSGCGFGESRLNPFNWFGSSEPSAAVEPVVLEAPRDTRPLVAQVTSLRIERTPSGAIIHATGLPPVQGWYGADLVNEDRDGRPIEGVLTYSFRARPPADTSRVSTVQSRELTVGVFVSNITLANTRSIRVTGAINARTARR